ncbi:hypothetical protein CFK38_07475 [Brachybacterium vulturis]|uniref:Transmembrane protein n=1 Tax=Brachybacterium vulturis TaxID=2017484 RepID=A0A291GSY4_9MICO|nr:hypothetical protein CFK38_07475 [Brachybacterium vulturis]
MRVPVATGTLAAAALAGLLVWTLAVPVGDLSLELADGRTVGPGAVVLAAVAGGAAAWLLLALLARTRRGRARWAMIAVVVLLLSLGSPALAGASGGALPVLLLMHLLVGGMLILGLRRSAVPRAAGGRTVSTEAP